MGVHSLTPGNPDKTFYHDPEEKQPMGTRPQSRKNPITIKQIGVLAFVFALAGGIYGFYTGGPVSMVIVFAECLIAAFVLLYLIASFIELFRK